MPSGLTLLWLEVLDLFITLHCNGTGSCLTLFHWHKQPNPTGFQSTPLLRSFCLSFDTFLESFACQYCCSILSFWNINFFSLYVTLCCLSHKTLDHNSARIRHEGAIYIPWSSKTLPIAWERNETHHLCVRYYSVKTTWSGSSGETTELLSLGKWTSGFGLKLL